MAAGVAAATFVPSFARSQTPIRLSRSQNAYGPSPKVIAAMHDAARNTGADPEEEADKLRTAIAAVHRVLADHVVLGCGSTEVMRAAVSAFVSPSRPLVVALPTYDVIVSFADRMGAETLSFALSGNYAHDLSAMLAHSQNAGLVYVCNPNNPTGSLTRRRDLETFIRALPQTTHVLIDEAYHHYVVESADYASFVDRRFDDDRVIVLRSFSKVYGLAGLRIGYAIANPKTARLLASWLPGDMNTIAARAAVAALKDTEHVLTSVRRNGDDRQEFLNQANARMVRAIDSQTNFVMLNTGRPAIEVIAHFKQNNIELPGVIPSLSQHIRVSLGTPADMMEFWRVWDLIPAKMVM